MNVKFNIIEVEIKKEIDIGDFFDIPDLFVELLISAEDHRFYLHRGVDPIAILRAIYKTVFCGCVEGGSTISMQLVRVITGSYERKLSRKIREMYLAIAISKIVSKADMPKIYLSKAYFGWKMNGIHEACKFKKIDIHNATIMDAAEIIARLKYPETKKLNFSRRKLIKNRAEHIVRRHEKYFLSNINVINQESIVSGSI